MNPTLAVGSFIILISINETFAPSLLLPLAEFWGTAMKNMRSALLGTFLALVVTSATAQPVPPQQNWGYGPWMMGQGGMMGGYPMGPWMMGRGGMMGGQGGAWMCGMMNYQMSGRLAYLKTELQITGAQEALWNAYANAVQDTSKGMVARCNTMMGGNAWNTLSLPDRLSRHEQFMAVQLDALRVIDRSLKPLYAALNDGQKKVADQLIWCPMGMM